MDGMSALWLDGHTDVLERLLHKSFKNLPHTFAMVGGSGVWGENHVLGRFMVGSQPLCSQFPGLY